MLFFLGILQRPVILTSISLDVRELENLMQSDNNIAELESTGNSNQENFVENGPSNSAVQVPRIAEVGKKNSRSSRKVSGSMKLFTVLVQSLGSLNCFFFFFFVIVTLVVLL